MKKLLTIFLFLLLIIGLICLIFGIGRDIFQRKKIDKHLSKIATEVKGTKNTPVYIIDDFLDKEECRMIIDEFQGTYIKSPLTRHDPNDQNFRTSMSTFFKDDTNNQKYITNKILKTINLKSKCSERAQIQHYKIGNEFKSHWDWFDPKLEKEYYDKGQRTWTFMVYLNDVDEGGETYFNRLDLSITPKLGRAVVWANLNSNGEVDYDTQHAGTPIKQGEKYIITKWFKLEDNF